LLLCGIAAVAWIAGKIYRVGILSTGKRPSLAELARWVRGGVNQLTAAIFQLPASQSSRLPYS
jgi:hypothetical protein